MKTATRLSSIALTFGLAAALNPWAQAQTPTQAPMTMPMPMPAKPMAQASGAMATPMPMPMQMPMHGGMDMKGMMKGMNDNMAAMLMSGNTDIDFAKMMREHHVGAIDMAQAQLQNGKEPQMRKLAKEIIAAQKKEIATIDKFLATHPHAADKMSK
ncbi:MAG: DUF305 domain-containing protein [Burkholderiaceae bacterium]